MQKENVFLDVMVKRFLRANRIPPVRPPQIPPFLCPGRRGSDSALNDFAGMTARRGSPWSDANKISRFARRRSQKPLIAVARNIALALVIFVLTLSAQAGVREVGAIGLTVNDLGRELNFYTNTLPFELVSVSEAGGKEQEELLGLSGAKLRVATLKLGDERITLTEHAGKKGRPIPAGLVIMRGSLQVAE